jgi:hypothetical protein
MALPDFEWETLELRCRGTMHGIVKNGSGTLEVKCKHWACTSPRSVTYHVFDLATGELLETHTYKDPIKEKK